MEDPPRYDAVLFDLLTALLDSWSLWGKVAGSPEAGRLWRGAYLASTYAQGAYRPYEDLVTEAAQTTGHPRSWGAELIRRSDELSPWPGVVDTLSRLQGRVKIGIVTNCSEALGRRAAARVAASFDCVVTAERAGFYKPHPRPYELALEELGVPRERALFVAGSAYDLIGTGRVGLRTVWHNATGMGLPPAVVAANVAPPLSELRFFEPLADLVLGVR
jgi:2-haloalkanoic acid dehalogenase type II